MKKAYNLGPDLLIQCLLLLTLFVGALLFGPSFVKQYLVSFLRTFGP